MRAAVFSAVDDNEPRENASLAWIAASNGIGKEIWRDRKMKPMREMNETKRRK
jgi:hypothetical protein